MKNRLIACARGALLIGLILGIPALLFGAYNAAMAILQAASHADTLLEWLLLGLGLLITLSAVLRLCIVGIKRTASSRQNLSIGGGLAIISALSLVWVLIVVLSKPTGRLTVSVKYHLGQRDFHGADLSGADLSFADLSGANMSGANLSEADLSLADLSGVNLSGANLSEADLSFADLSGTNLSRADLTGANVSRAQMEEASLFETTLPDGTVLE